jgi:hypothetical protein
MTQFLAVSINNSKGNEANARGRRMFRALPEKILINAILAVALIAVVQ